MWMVNWCHLDKSQLRLDSCAPSFRWQRILLATATKVVNPTLSSTLCQLFVRTSTHTNPLATNHVWLAIQMPQATTHSHISCAHCKQLQHSHSLPSFIVATSCAACSLARTPHTRLTLPIVCAIVPASRHSVRWRFLSEPGFRSVCLCTLLWSASCLSSSRWLVFAPRCTCTELRNCSSNPQRCSSFWSCVLGRFCFFWLSERQRAICVSRLRSVRYKGFSGNLAFRAPRYTSILASVCICQLQTIFVRPMDFYSTMIS